MIDLNNIKTLTEVKSTAGIQPLTPTVTPGNHCPMTFAAKIVREIEGLSTLIVGMPECTTYSRYYSPEPETPYGELHWLYTLDSSEVVFGCRNGIIDALRKMDAAGAEAIFIIATCIPELIGEDIEGIIQEIQPEITARLSFALLGQFKNVGNTSGPGKTMNALLALMDEQKTDPSHVNILADNTGRRQRVEPFLLTTLRQKGFSLRQIGQGTSVENLQNAPDARLNLVLSANTLPLALAMEESFGTPYLDMHSLCGVAEMDQTYSDLAGLLNFRWNGEFHEERQQAIRLEQQARERFQGTRSVFTTRVESPLMLAAYLGGFGMQPLLLHLEEYQAQDAIFSRIVTDMGYNPRICRMLNLEAEMPILAELGPDIIFGRVSDENNRRTKDGFREKGFRPDKSDGARGRGGHDGNGSRKEKKYYGGKGWGRHWMEENTNANGRGKRLPDKGGMEYRQMKERGMQEHREYKGGKGMQTQGVYNSIPWTLPFTGAQIGYARINELLYNAISALGETDAVLRRAS